jgi:hypothetical protein
MVLTEWAKNRPAPDTHEPRTLQRTLGLVFAIDLLLTFFVGSKLPNKVSLKLAWPLITRMVKRQQGGDMRKLKDLMESPQPFSRLIVCKHYPMHCKSNPIHISNQTQKGEIKMSTIVSKSLGTRNSLVRLIVLGGLFIFIAQAINQLIVVTLIQKTPFSLVWQYIASGALGEAAFAGGMGTALLGLFFHLIISFAIAAVFILAANRMPLLRRNLIVGSLLYGLGVWIVMNMVVTPLSAAPPLPMPTLPTLIWFIIEHALFVGLALGIIVQRNANNTAS